MHNKYIIYLLFLFSSCSRNDQSDLEEEFHPKFNGLVYHSNYNINYLNESSLIFQEKIGKGRFSEVRKVTLSNGTLAAAKMLWPNDSWKYKREIELLEKSSQCPNVINLYGVYGDEESPIIVTEFLQQSSYYFKTYEDFKWVIKALLETVACIHSMGIFHRDIKNQNLLIDYKNKQLRLIDWGFAEYYFSNYSYPTRIGTKSYKAPELLLGYPQYTQSIDIWACGIFMANMILGIPTLFSGANNKAVLNKQATFFGSKTFEELSFSLGKPKFFRESFGEDLFEYALPHTKQLFSQAAVDLLYKLLEPNFTKRITATEALNHAFFS